MGVTLFLLVSCLGLAITAQAQSCSKPNAGPNMSLKDEFILTDTFSDGAKASFKCDVGYIAESGSPSITCTAGRWSTVTLHCGKKSCGALDEVPNAEYDYSEGIEFGDRVVITCKKGFVMPGSEQKRVLYCGDKGWDGRQPVCEPVTCDPPPAVVAGSYSPLGEIYNYNDVIQYSCSGNLVANGSESRTCSENGTFTPAAPTCVSVECKDPVIPNADWVDGSRPPHKYKASVKYRCQEGYRMEGSANQICDINSQWSPGLPTCLKVTCIPPNKVVNGTYSPNKPSYYHQDVIEYSCLTQDFILIGSKTRTCSLDGTFKPDPPTCLLVECKEPKIENADQIEGSPPYRLHSTVKFKCKSGYEMIGSPTVTCAKNNEWTTVPTCKKIPTTTPTTTTTTTKPPRGDGDSLSSGIIVLIILVVLAVIGSPIIYCCCCSKKKRGEQVPVNDVEIEEGVELSGNNKHVAGVNNGMTD